MEQETLDKLKEIKRGFRLMMNGVASGSMRNKGLGYKINWGVSLTDLQDVAARYGKDYELAVELWKENIRECKILATMIMPAEKMQPDLAELWMEQTTSQEIAEMAAFYLYRYIGGASDMAFKWIASDRDIYQICGYNILSRLFMQGDEPDERDINEFVDQVLTALCDTSLSVRHAASACMSRFVSLGDNYALIAEKALKSAGLELFYM